MLDIIFRKNFNIVCNLDGLLYINELILNDVG